jgi:MGT family glycosyltransferase
MIDMQNIVICSQRLLGHVIPILGVGKELRNKGYQVTFLGNKKNKQLIEKAGLKYREIGWDKYPTVFITEMLEEVLFVLKESKVGLIITDSSLCAPAYAAEILDIPWISFQTTIPLTDHLIPGVPSVNKRLRVMMNEKLDKIRKQYSLSPLNDFQRTRGDFLGLSPFLHLIMVYPEFISDNTFLPDSAKVVGDCSSEEQDVNLQISIMEKVRKKEFPVILVCTSSVPRVEFREIMNQYIEHSIAAFGTKNFHLIILEGYQYQGDSRLPPNVHWLSVHPIHNKIMPFTDVVITHGGCGTLQKCLKYGKPMIIIPLGADHSHLAQRCKELGIAEVIPPYALTPKQIKQTTYSIMQSPIYNKNGSELAHHIAQRSPIKQCIDEIERILISYY